MNTQDNIRMESQKDPAQLEREIDQQRSHIEQIVSALENKLSPGEIFDRVLNLGKGGGKEFAGNLTDTIKANPVPALLAATGLLWLYSGRDKQPGSSMSSSYSPTTGTTMGSSASLEQQYGMHEKSGGMREKLGNAKSRVGESAHNAAGSIRSKAHSAAESARHGATRANEGFHRLLDENPMAAGAIGIAVGALLGSLIPTTRKEDELMGQTSDRITGKAKEMARAGRDSLTSAGREVIGSSSGQSGGMNADNSDDMSPGSSITSTTTVSSTTTSTSPARPH